MEIELAPPPNDGLYAPEVGPWAAHRTDLLWRYVDAYTETAKARRHKGPHFFDLRAGAGIEEAGDGKLVWGSPLVAAQTTNRFEQMHLCVADRRPYRALHMRLARFPQPESPEVIWGNANRHVDLMVSHVLTPARSLAVLDPTDLDLEFAALRRLANRPMDFIILFPNHLDAIGHWKGISAADGDPDLDRAFGTDRWQSVLSSSPRESWPAELRQVYVEQLQTLGFRDFAHESLTGPPDRQLYGLLFCSQREGGADLWREVTAS